MCTQAKGQVDSSSGRVIILVDEDMNIFDSHGFLPSAAVCIAPIATRTSTNSADGLRAHQPVCWEDTKIPAT